MAEATLEARQMIERDRAALAETLQALAAKADVKGRVRDTLHEDAAKISQKAEALGPRLPLALLATVVVLAVAAGMVRARRR